MAAAVGAVGKIGPTEAVRADTRSARGELMESPGSCPTRLCRTEGSPQHSVEAPARAARPSEPLWGSAPAEYSGAALATGGEEVICGHAEAVGLLVEHEGACRMAGIGVPPCMRQRKAMRLVWSSS